MNHIKVFFSVILLTISFLVQSQDEIKKNYYEALKILNRMEEIAGLETVKSYNYSFLYEGDFYNYGHYATPEEAKNYSVKGYSQFYNNLRAENEEVLSASQKTYSRKSIIDSDSVLFIDFGESEIEKGLAYKFRYINLFSPLQIIELINRNKKSLHLLEESPKKKVIGFNDSNGDKYYLEIDSSYLISRISKLAYEDTHGDILEVIEFDNYETLNEYKFPKTIFVRKGSRLIKSLECSSFKLYPQDSTLSKALNYPLPKLVTSKFEFLKISENIFLCRMLDLNNKVLLYIKDDEISVFEAPGNLNSGRHLIEAIKEEFPAKKIKNCFISHHHPDHAGSIMAFMEIGAAIITTEDNRLYFQSLASEKHSIGVPRELVMPDDIIFETVSRNSSKNFLKNKVSVHEIGDFTEHTNEYLIFYFPKEKVLFVGDLILFPDERIVQQGKRAFSIYEASRKFDLEIKRIYTSWPLHGYKDFGTWEDFLASLKSSYPELN